MTVVAIVNQKGGTGKTTLANNLAWTLASKALLPAVGRADPQASSQSWSRRPGQIPDTLTVRGTGNDSLTRLVPSMANDYDWVIIDGTTRHHENQRRCRHWWRTETS